MHYDLEFDPRKSNRSFTIGEVLPAPKKGTFYGKDTVHLLPPVHHYHLFFATSAESIPVGPGYYNLEKVLATGETAVLSSTANLHKKPVAPFDTYRRAMSKSLFVKTKSSFNS